MKCPAQTRVRRTRSIPGDSLPGAQTPTWRGDHVQGSEFRRELERRLEILEAPDYEDPARKDLPALDLVLLAVSVIAITVVMYWWGY